MFKRSKSHTWKFNTAVDSTGFFRIARARIRGRLIFIFHVWDILFIIEQPFFYFITTIRSTVTVWWMTFVNCCFYGAILVAARFLQAENSNDKSRYVADFLMRPSNVSILIWNLRAYLCYSRKSFFWRRCSWNFVCFMLTFYQSDLRSNSASHIVFRLFFQLEKEKVNTIFR